MQFLNKIRKKKKNCMKNTGKKTFICPVYKKWFSQQNNLSTNLFIFIHTGKKFLYAKEDYTK